MGSSMILLLLSIVAFVAMTEATPTSHKLEVCDQHAKDAEECNRKFLQKVLHKFKDGDEHFGIPPIDPLTVPKMEITHGSGPDMFKVKITDGQATGISDMHVHSVKLSPKEHTFECTGTLHELTLTGDYEMIGDFIGISTEGKGKCAVKLVNVGVRLFYRGNLIKKGCHQFFNITNLIVEVHPQEMKSQYSNLYGGDRDMARSTLSLLNQFDAEVLILLGPSINHELSRIFRPVIQNIHDRWAYDDMFPEFKVPCPEN